MKKNMVNTCHIEGILYEHDLALKVTGENSKHPGTQFITGTMSIATDDAITNIVPIHFTYVTAVTGKGNANATFTVLKNIIDGSFKTYMEDKDKAVKIRVDSAIGLNEFSSTRNGTEEWVSVKRNEGGFVHVVSDALNAEAQRSTFKCDMLITRTTRLEEDVDRNLPERMTLKGAIFDFRGSLLPVEFTVTNPSGMNYFESLEASEKNPVFTQVWGQQISETVVRQIVTESAFGDADVREVRNTRRDFVVSGSSPELPAQDDPSTITFAELSKAIADREVYLAAEKTRQAEYRASRDNASAFGQTPAAPAASTPVDKFKF